MKRILFFLLLPCFLFPQVWIEKMQDPNHNFYDTQKEFETYWKDREIEKGKGWKQFKRWEAFIEPRVYPDGVQYPEVLFQEYNNFIEANNHSLILPNNTWEQVGPDNVPLESSGRKRGIGRVNSIAFHPTDPSILYVGAPAGGFWKSINHGQTWNTTTDFLTNLGVSDIAISPSNPDEIFIITGDRDGGDTYSYGLMKSDDGGMTFNTTGLSFNITNYYKGCRVLIDPSNTNVIIVATSTGIHRSVDNGLTFVHVYNGINITDIEFHPTNTSIIYAASKGNTSVYKSTDNGVNWSNTGNGLPPMNDVVRACVAVTPDNPQVVYALFGDNNNGFYAVYKSIDEGATWTQQANSPNLLGWSVNGTDNDGQAWYDLAFAVSPNDENTLFVGGVNTWKSVDGGQSWDINTHWYGASGTTYMHADEHMFRYNPLNNNIYSGNDGGLYFSDDDGNSWSDISDGLHITQFYSLGVSQTVQDIVITGSQDNGTFLKSNLNWEAVIGGDGMECIIDYTNSDIMYGALYYGDVRKSTNGGNSFSSIGPSNNGAWETPYELDKNDPNTIYIGYDELQKSTDGGNSWNQITNGETNGGKIDEIGLSKSNSDVIYITDNSNIFRTINGGANWSQINNNLPNKYITYVIVHPLNENKVWVTLSGYTAGEKVYQTIDGGNSWVNLSGSLPNIPANCIELDVNSNLETVYIGTDLGVFKIDSTSNDWNPFNNNSLPNVIVNELEIQYQSNKLFAATYGRGLWSIDMEITSPPIANFSYSDSVFCNVPANVDFSNNSYYSNSYYWDFGDGATSSATNPTHTYNSFGTYTVKLVAIGPLGMDSIIKQQIISIDQNNYCITTLPISGSGNLQTLCNGTLYDVGGPNSNYYDQTDCWITIAPPGSNQITLNFNSFDVEAPSSNSYCNWDYLEIFDGADTSAPSLGQFCNALTGSPGTIVSSGGAITVLLHSDQAVNGTGFEADWTCQFPSSPPSSMFEISDSISCNGMIFFTDISTNGPISWLWDFGDGNTSSDQHPFHHYINSGIYDVKLTTTNQYGADSIVINNVITVLDLNLQTFGDTSCVNSSFVLDATSIDGNINWYDAADLQNLVHIGSSFTTPVLNNTTSYFVQSVYDFPSLFGGPNDNNFGAGSYYQGDRHLVFDCYYSSTLVSVLVYANSDGFRTIELRNSTNLVLQDTTVFIPSSANGTRVSLNFTLPVENNLQLGMANSNNDMYRNSSGAVFPYDIGGIVSITGTNAPPGYYYFFYDWEVQKESCSSNISEVIAMVDSTTSSLTNISECDTYTWSGPLGNGSTYTSSGIYTHVSTDANGCLHTETLDLTINNSTSGTTNAIRCDSYIWSGPLGNGTTYTSSGIYTHVSTNALGCSHTETLDLTINSSNTGASSEIACDSYDWDGASYTTSGAYTNTFANIVGCDSLHTLNLIIINANTGVSAETACDSYTWDGVSYTTSGAYTNTYTNAVGCDSVHTLNLTINYSNAGSSSEIACDSYAWDGGTYTQSGAYTNTYTNASGCDSVHTLNLTINYYNTGLSAITACDSYAWNGATYTQSGSYTNTYTNALGCDSVHTLNLTINYSNTGLSAITACDSYAWDGATYTQSGAYTNTYANELGCDSVHTLNLMINYSTTSSSAITACDSYAWGGVLYTTSGAYTNTYTNAAGCIHTEILNLTIDSGTIINQSFSLCAGDSIIVGSNIYYNTGSYTDLFFDVNGCDSILETEVQISELSVNLTYSSLILTAVAIGGVSPYDFEIGGENGPILNSTNIVGNNSVSINPISNGVYYCFIIDANNCVSDTVFYEVDVFPSYLNEVGLSNLLIFPNPTSGVVNISFYNTSPVKIRMCDILGKYIYSYSISENGKVRKELDISDQSSGVYIIEISSEYGVINKKIILE